jgi:hypothetical protein
VPDSITPVGAQIQPPNPMSGINTISGIIGLQQQQQNLQTGQYQQQAAQAQAQQSQQKNQELQAAQQLVVNAAKQGDFRLPNGDFDRISAANKISQIGPYAQEMSGQLLTQANELVQNQQAVQNLSSDARAKGAAQLAALATRDPKLGPLTPSDGIDALTQLAKDNPSLIRTAISMSGAIPPNATDAQLRSIFQRASISTMSPEGATGLTLPGQATTGAGTVNRSPITGGLSAPPGAPPGSPINPTPPQVAGAIARQTGTGNADIDTSNMVVAGQREARTNIDLTKRIDQLADVVSPGKLPADVSAGLGALGLQNVNQARTELVKDLGRLQTNYTSRAGSDERARTILSGLPTDTTPTQTIHQAMDFTRGSARQDLALGALRQKNAAATNGQMNGFQGDYAHAVGAASPLMHEYLSLSPQDQVGFFQRNFKTKAQAQAFRAQAESVRKMSPDVVGQ